MRQLSLFLCLRYLRSRKIVLLSIAAVAMSCALLIAVGSLFTGFIDAFETGASAHMGDVILSGRSTLKIEEFDGLIEALEADERIAGATAILSGQGLLLLGRGDVRAVQVWGIELPGREDVTPVKEHLLRQADAAGAATFAGPETAAEGGGFVGIGVVADPHEETDEYDFEGIRQAYLGRRVMLTTGTVQEGGGEAGPQFTRRTVKFDITDVVFTGMHQIDEEFIYLPLERLSAELYPKRGKLADAIQVKLAEDVGEAEGIAAVTEVWRQWSAGRVPWSDLAQIRSSRQMQAVLVAEYHKQMQMLLLIFGVVSAGVILLVFCIFYLIVMTKQKDIAILKSCGLGASGVTALFVGFGLFIGLVGSGVGIVLGYLITVNVNTVERWISLALGLKLWKSSTYMFSRIPNEVDWGTVEWVAVAAVLAAGLGALIPAIGAARVEPVKILRYE